MSLETHIFFRPKVCLLLFHCQIPCIDDLKFASSTYIHLTIANATLSKFRYFYILLLFHNSCESPQFEPLPEHGRCGRKTLLIQHVQGT